MSGQFELLNLGGQPDELDRNFPFDLSSEELFKKATMGCDLDEIAERAVFSVGFSGRQKDRNEFKARLKSGIIRGYLGDSSLNTRPIEEVKAEIDGLAERVARKVKQALSQRVAK